MKNLGIFAGGFKPFTSGHFAKLALASEENDLVLLFYGLSKRQKGSDFIYTEEMARKTFDIAKSSIEQKISNVKVIEAKPSPIAMVFSTIGRIFIGKQYEGLDSSIDLSEISKVTVYTDSVDAQENYLRYSGTPKEKLYFGEALQEGSLKFDYGVDEKGSPKRMIEALKKYSSEEITEEHVLIRGSEMRSLLQSRNKNKASQFLPPILSDSAKKEFLNILLG